MSTRGQYVRAMKKEREANALTQAIKNKNKSTTTNYIANPAIIKKSTTPTKRPGC